MHIILQEIYKQAAFKKLDNDDGSIHCLMTPDCSDFYMAAVGRENFVKVLLDKLCLLAKK